MSTPHPIILGIDPGTRKTGYGLIQITPQGLQPIDFGCISPPPSLDLPARYLVLFNGIEALITRFQPHALAVETQFVYKNIASALKLGMARGVALVSAARHQIPIHEYAPKKVKLAVGHGSASKQQVQRMVQLLLNLTDPPEPEDAADALAIAICHSHTLSRRIPC